MTGDVVLDSATTDFTSYTPYELGKQYDTTSQEAKRTHYPHLLAPPSLRTSNLPSTRPQRYLNPALWDAVTLGNKTAESQLQAYMWQTESTCNPTRTFTPDSVTTYDYDYDNRLTTVNLPTNNDTVEYTYDATGRRLTKEYTYHNGANTDVTTYKYHYIGGNITEIEINAIRNPGESQTTLRDEEIKIHLGANSQPISYEWVKHISGNTTSATYYYHYDIHGNVLKVTDSSENTKITYTYDVLGKILTESNPDSVLNFFTFRGASQTIWESEIGFYYSGGYYRPDTGTALQGTGAPVLTNPASSAMLSAMAEATAANAQLTAHAAVSASSAGSSGRSFAPPPGPGDGLAQTNSIAPTPTTDSVEPVATITDGCSDNLLVGMPECECGSIYCSKCKGNQKRPNSGMVGLSLCIKKPEEKKDPAPTPPGNNPNPKPPKFGKDDMVVGGGGGGSGSGGTSGHTWDPIAEAMSLYILLLAHLLNIDCRVIGQMVNNGLDPWRIDPANPNCEKFFAIWGTYTNKSTNTSILNVLGFQVGKDAPIFFTGIATKIYDGDKWVDTGHRRATSDDLTNIAGLGLFNSWVFGYDTIYSFNNTGENIIIMLQIKQVNDDPNDSYYCCNKIFIPRGSSSFSQLKTGQYNPGGLLITYATLHYDNGSHGDPWPGTFANDGAIHVVKSNGEYGYYQYGKNGDVINSHNGTLSNYWVNWFFNEGKIIWTKGQKGIIFEKYLIP